MYATRVRKAGNLPISSELEPLVERLFNWFEAAKDRIGQVIADTAFLVKMPISFVW